MSFARDIEDSLRKSKKIDINERDKRQAKQNIEDKILLEIP